MSTRKPGDEQGDERDLQALLVKSLESLRQSPAHRGTFPALERMLSRIEARERTASRDRAKWLGWLRPLVGPMTAAAAGFAGAALALTVLPVGGLPPPSTVAPSDMSQILPTEAREDFDRSIRRLENAIRGLEKFQPLLESRIEWVEDVVQRHHRDAYVSVDHKEDNRRGQQPAARPRSGKGV